MLNNLIIFHENKKKKHTLKPYVVDRFQTCIDLGVTILIEDLAGIWLTAPD